MSAIFISHNSLDAKAAAKIRAWLGRKGHDSVYLDFDPDVGTPAGTTWERELYSQLKFCRAVIALLSPGWTSSKWCFAEVAIARLLGKHIFPIKIVPTDPHPILADTQFIDFTIDEAEAFQRLARGLEAAGIRAGDAFDWKRERSPYPGLAAFQHEDAAVYFGRETEIGVGLDVLNRVRRYGGSGFVLILGASGSGKSSLMRAGIIPRLRRDAEHWRVLDPIRPGEDPFTELAAVLSSAFRQVGRDLPWKSIHERLVGAGRESGGAGVRAVFLEVVDDLRLQGSTREASTILPIDQFEELLSRRPDHPGTLFIAFLHALLSTPSSVVVLATMRADFLEALQKTQHLGSLDAQRIVLSPLPVEGLTQAIEQPAELAGVRLETGLVQAILKETDTDDALPLLAFTLRELYEAYAGDGEITVAEFRDGLGGLQGSVAKVADALLAAQPLAKDDEEQLRRAFLAMVRIDENGHYTRRPVRWEALPATVHPLMEAFVKARLLVSRVESGGRELEIAHEALFRAWSKLRGWLEESSHELRLRQELQEAADLWKQASASDEYLWTGNRLGRALELRARDRLAMSENDLAFLVQSERVSKRVQTQRARLRRFVTGGAVIAATVMGLLAIRERGARKEAERQRQITLSGRLAAQSISYRDEKLDLALLLSVQAMRTAPNVEAPRSLLTSLMGSAHVRAFLPNNEGSPDMITFSPDGKKVAVISGTKVLLHDVDKLAQDGSAFELPNPDIAQSTWGIAFSSDGRILATSNAGDFITLWDVAKHEPIGRFRAGPGLSIRALTFLTGDTIVASAGCPVGPRPGLALRIIDCPAGAIHLWDVRTRRAVGAPLQTTGCRIQSLVFDGNSRRLIAGCTSGEIEIWDASARRLVRTLSGHTDEVNDLAVDAEGLMLASASDDRSVRLWNLRTGAPYARLEGHTGPVSEVAFHRNGTFLASASEDSTISFWSLVSGRRMTPVLTQHSAPVQGLALSPTDDLIVSGSVDGTVIVWDVLDRSSISQSDFFDHVIQSVATSSDGRFVAIGGANGHVKVTRDRQDWIDTTVSKGDVEVAIHPKAGLLAAGACPELEGSFGCRQNAVWLWDLESRASKGVLRGGNAHISSLTFDPTGSLMAVGDATGKIQFWDMATKSQRPASAGHTERVHALAFNPKGDLMASAGYDYRLILWDPRTGKRVKDLPAPGGTMLTVAFSPDGKLLAAGGGDKKVFLFDVATGRQAFPALASHTSSVFHVAFSPNGAMLVSGSYDRSILLWDVSTQQLLGRLLAHSEGVTSLSFTENGRVLYSVGRDGKLMRWDLAEDSWMSVACGIANRNLTFSEWRQYIGNEQYAKTCDASPVHPSVVQWGRELAAVGDVDAGVAVLKRAVALDTTLQIDPEREAKRSAALALAKEGQAQSREGQILEAIGSFARAVRLGMERDITAETWNALCWHGSLRGYAKDVMYACVNAVSFASEEEKPFFRDSRGLARALTGDSPGAIADFRAFTEWALQRPEYLSYGKLREEWVRQMAVGKSPFDSVTLKKLRIEQ